MSRSVAVPLLALLAACEPTGGLGGFDQDEADLVAIDLVPELVPVDAPYLLVRAGEVAAGEPIVEPAPPSLETPPLELVPETAAYLYFLDLAPWAYFGHDTAWILVDEDGAATSHTARWWPEIGGQVPPAILDALEQGGGDDVIDAQLPFERPTGRAPVFDLQLPEVPEEDDAYIVVQGLLPGETLYWDASATGATGRAFFEAYMGPASETTYLADDEADTVFDVLEAAAADHTTVTVAIIAHGDPDQVKLGGTWFGVDEFTAVFAAHPDTTFNFLLGSCHGGSFVDDLTALPNAGGLLTAVSATEVARPDWDYAAVDGVTTPDVNRPDIGSEWFSSIYAAAATLTDTPEAFDTVTVTAARMRAPLSTALLCLGGQGALGELADDGLGDDLDLSHRSGGHTPQRDCPAEWIPAFPAAP